jgi:hypothetical protein
MKTLIRNGRVVTAVDELIQALDAGLAALQT